MAVSHYENFPVASLLLPARLREPVEIIYSFARSADDFADEGSDPPQARLQKLNDYRAQLAAPSTPLFRDLEKIIREHGLPIQLFADLLDAFSQDVTQKRYENFPQLMDYCRRSANPVGRLLLHLFKRTTDSELARSDAICSALQLINFWQDVDIDYAKGRVYLPQDEMAAHGVGERHLAEGAALGPPHRPAVLGELPPGPPAGPAELQRPPQGRCHPPERVVCARRRCLAPARRLCVVADLRCLAQRHERRAASARP